MFVLRFVVAVVGCWLLSKRIFTQNYFISFVWQVVMLMYHIVVASRRRSMVVIFSRPLLLLLFLSSPPDELGWCV
jgi:hypothetical protein